MGDFNISAVCITSREWYMQMFVTFFFLSEILVANVLIDFLYTVLSERHWGVGRVGLICKMLAVRVETDPGSSLVS